MLVKLPVRKSDKWGEGHFGAPRGDHTHHGIDLACYPGSEILSLSYGTVTKLGYPYSDDLSFRYVEITDEEDLKLRYFYVFPNSLAVGDIIHQGQNIGISQNLFERYPGITGHVHFEIMDQRGSYIDPTDFL